MNRGFGRASLKHEYAPRTAVTADGCVIPAVALELRVLQCRHRCEWFSGTGWSPLGWVGERFAKWCATASGMASCIGSVIPSFSAAPH